jgi:hypothetical protein
MPASIVEIGRVGGWQYVIARRGNEFEVVRQDVRFDQTEGSLGLALTLKSAIRRGTAAMIRDIRIKKKRINQLDWLQKQSESGRKSSQCNVRN